MGIISITHFSSQLNYAERPGTPVRQRVVCLGRGRCEGASPSPLPCPPLFHAPLLCPSPTPSPRPRFLPVTPKYDVQQRRPTHPAKHALLFFKIKPALHRPGEGPGDTGGHREAARRIAVARRSGQGDGVPSPTEAR